MLDTAFADMLQEYVWKYLWEWKEALLGVFDMMFGELDCDFGRDNLPDPEAARRSFPMSGRWMCTLTWVWYRRFG